MPIIRCYIDEDTDRFMRQIALENGRTVEQLAEAAIENAAIAAGYRKPQSHWTTELQRATGAD